MEYAPFFKVGWVYLEEDGEIGLESLKRLASVSTGLCGIVPKLSREFELLKISVGDDVGVNKGQFERMPFASFPEVRFTDRPQQYIRRGPYCYQNFPALFLRVSYSEIGGNLLRSVRPSAEKKDKMEAYREGAEKAAFKAARKATEKLGLPDFFTFSDSPGEVSREFAKFVLPEVERRGFGFADLDNTYLAIVSGNQARDHEFYVREHSLRTSDSVA